MGPTGHERRRDSTSRRGDAALAWEPHVEAFIGHGYGPNSDGSARLPWFLSLRAGGNMPPRRAFAARTIRSVNKGIGIRAENGPRLSAVSASFWRTIPGRTCRMPERGTTGTWNRQHSFLKAAGRR